MPLSGFSLVSRSPPIFDFAVGCVPFIATHGKVKVNKFKEMCTRTVPLCFISLSVKLEEVQYPSMCDLKSVVQVNQVCGLVLSFTRLWTRKSPVFKLFFEFRSCVLWYRTWYGMARRYRYGIWILILSRLRLVL
jgi:hypothetical protein